MTTLSYSELVTAVRREGEGIHAAAGLGLDADVPTCGDWDVAALVRHITRVYLSTGVILTSRATEQPQRRPEVPDGDPLEVFGNALDELVTALKDCEGETPVWNWATDQPDLAMFWARRMAHESSVHRFDAQTAHGVVQPIDAEIAGDGLDELVDVIVPRVYARDEITTGATGTISLQSSDDGSWCLELHADGISRMDVINEPDVVVHGTTSALMLAAYSRMPWTSLKTEGDTSVLTGWSETLNF
jgi:uncharacterized protein (TIGR03083 family)